MSATESEAGYGISPTYGEGGYGVSIVTRTASTTVTLEEQGELTVQVNDDDGTGVDGASVSIEASDGSHSDSDATDANGQIVFGGIPIAGYTVTVSKTGYFDATVDVAAGDFT